uniref:ZP domain-containing protein n=1 Tax=Erpetoichthys calabaricus TaxID=27687 RepID=A0A8C4RL94_ERPCA
MKPILNTYLMTSTLMLIFQIFFFPSALTSEFATVSHTRQTATSASTAAFSQRSTTSTISPEIQKTSPLSVTCMSQNISVTVTKAFLNQKAISESSLYLGTPQCNVSSSNDTHVMLRTAKGICGTNITYVSPFVFRHTHLQVPITFYIFLYNMLPCGNKPLLKNQTLTPDEEVLIDVSLNLGLPNARIVLNRCWATPSENLSDTTSYEFINNSCLIPNPHTTMIQNGKSSRAQVLMKVFSFVKENVVYLHCQIMLCIEDVGKSCQPNCRLRATRSSEGGTMKSASNGPLQKDETAELILFPVFNS